jgi:hypothetical protein
LLSTFALALLTTLALTLLTTFAWLLAALALALLTALSLLSAFSLLATLPLLATFAALLIVSAGFARGERLAGRAGTADRGEVRSRIGRRAGAGRLGIGRRGLGIGEGLLHLRFLVGKLLGVFGVDDPPR